MPAYLENPTYDTLLDALYESYTLDILRPLAKLVCHNIPSRKMDMVHAICGAMLSANLKSHFDRLDSIEKAAVQEAIFSPDGALDPTKFKAKYQQAAPIGRSFGWRSKGYLVDLFIVNRHVPEDLGLLLIEFIKKPEEDRIQYQDKLPKSVLLDIYGETEERKLLVRNTASAAINNLVAVLRLVEGNKIKVSAKTGRPTLAAQKKLRGLLQDGDWYDKEILSDIGYIQAFAWPILLQGTGLAKGDGSTLKLTPRGKKALKGDFPQVIKDAWSRWQNNKFLDEFSRVDQIKGQKSSRGKTLYAAHTRRPLLCEGLLMCTPGKWLSVQELIRAMNSKGLDFEVARYTWKLYVGDTHYGHLDDYDDNAMIKKRYVLAYLLEYAATAGIIDVAYIHPNGALEDYTDLWAWDADCISSYLSRYDGLMHIRLNALGAFALGMADHYDTQTPDTRSVLTVLSNHDVVITDANALSPGDRLFLEKTCSRKTSLLWKLTTRTLLDAAQNGTTMGDIKSFLKSRSDQPLPQTVKTLINDAEKRASGLQYAGRTHLIKCKDPVLQKLVTRDTKLSKLCRPAGEKHMVILPGKEKQFMAALVKLGYIVPQLREQI